MSSEEEAIEFSKKRKKSMEILTKKTLKKKQNLVDKTNKNEKAESSSENSTSESEDENESQPKKRKTVGSDQRKGVDENAKSKTEKDVVKRKSLAREISKISKLDEKGEKSPKKQSKAEMKKKAAEQKKKEYESDSDPSSEDEEKKKTKKKEKRSFNCFHCHQTFQQTTELFMHTCKGKKEKGFTCEVCGKSYILRSSFINHKIIHSKKKPYKCTLCGKKSSQQSNHLYHMSHEHPGEKPFSCLFFPCSKGFMTRKEQKKHLILHKKILCKYCDQSFADRPTMLKHRESEHERYFEDKSKKSLEVSFEEEEVVAEASTGDTD